MIAFDGAVERLRRDTAAALGRAIVPDDIVAIAVSGGPDSMALLALAVAAWPGQVIAATMDHGLRAEAADEAAMVAGFCATLGPDSPLPATPAHDEARSGNGADDVGQSPAPTFPNAPRLSPVRCSGRETTEPGQRLAEGVPHAILSPATPLATTNLQATARTARYALLTEWATDRGATILATAHHADDQAETFLMRAARGSGLAGLAGIRPRRRLSETLTLVRPLLGWRCAELRALAESRSLPFVDDPSNASARYDRTRFRALLHDTALLDPGQLTRSAGYLAEADADLRVLEAWLLDTRLVPADPDHCVIDMAGLPREVRRRLARAAIGRVRETRNITQPAWSDAANVERLLDALQAGKSATQAGVMASPRAEIWHFAAAPPRRAG